MTRNIWDVRKLEDGLLVNRGELFRLGSAILFIVLIMLFAIARGPDGPSGTLLVMAAMIGGYMALNIGANDVANNVGPAVGSHAITLAGAIPQVNALTAVEQGATLPGLVEQARRIGGLPVNYFRHRDISRRAPWTGARNVSRMPIPGIRGTSKGGQVNP